MKKKSSKINDLENDLQRDSNDQNNNEKKSIKILKDYNIKDMIIGSILGKSIGMLSISFVNDLVLPILNQDFNNDGKKDITQLQDYVFQYKKYKFQIGNFIVTLIKVFISIIFALYSLKFI